MKNNFQSNGKGRNQRVWQLLISMLIILTMGSGQMWGATVTPSTGSHPNAFYSITSITTAQTMSTSSATNPGSREITSGATITGGKAYVGVKYTSSSTKGLTLNNSNCWKIDQNYIWCILNSTDAFVAGDTIFISNGATNAYAVSLNRATNATGDYTSNSSTYTASSSSPAKGSEYYFVLPSNFVSSNYLVINKSSSGNVDFSYVYACHASADPVCPGTLTITGTKAYTEGQKIELTASLSAGNGDITYQWYKGSVAAGNAISGATNAKYEKASCVLADADDYFCVASKDGCDSKTNAEAYTVTVSEAPFSGDASDLVTISAEYTFIPSETLTHGYLYYGKKLYSCGGSDLSYSADNKIKFSTSRKMAIKVAAGAHIKVTYNTSSSRYFYIGTTDGGEEIAKTNTGSVEGDYAAGGIVYLSASGDLNMTKLEITYPAPASASPTISAHPSTSAAQYFIGVTATALSVTATGSGTVTYQWYSNTTASNASGSAIEGATSASYTPSTAAEGTLYYYCAVTNTETSKSGTTLKSSVSGAITVIAAPTHLVENRLNVTSGDWSSNIYTNDPTNITSLTAWQIAAGQDRTTGVTDKQSIKNNRTHGIGTTATKTDGYYMYLSFTIADGKRLKLSAVNIPVFGISANKTTEVEIADANSTKITVNGTITADTDGNGFGTYDFSEAPYLQGAVTLKMWAYDATSGYRMKSPIYLDGAITAIPVCTPPAPPTGLQVDSKSHNSANLSWDGSGANANGYQIALTSATGAGTFVWKDEATRAYEATGLTPNTAYTFKVKGYAAGKLCSSDEVTVNFTTEAAPAQFTVHYMDEDGTTPLGSDELVVVGEHPVGLSPAPTKPLYTFAAWQKDAADIALDDAFWASVLKDAEVTLTARYEGKYASSINVEQWVLDNGAGKGATTKTSALLAEMGTKNYLSNIAWVNKTNELDTLDDSKTDGKRNYAYLGLKVKNDASNVRLLLQDGKSLKVKFGNVAATPNIKIGDAAATAMTITDGVYSLDAASGDREITISTTSAGAVVFKQIMINEDIAAVTLPWRVTYDANGGTCATAEAIWSGAALILPDVTPADADHTFAGWYDEVSGGSLIGAAGASYTPTDNTTLHAQFAPVEYAVNYAAGDHGSGDMAAANVGWGTEYTAVANGFTPETGYIFAGWDVSGVDGVSSIAAGGSFTMPKNPVTLTALWEDNSKVAVIVETNVKYESLADAITAAEAGQTIQLLQNIEQANGVAIAKNLTLDLNGKTFTCTSGSNVNSRAIKITAGNVTIQNGSIIAVPTANFEGGAYGPLRIEGATANVTLEDLTLQNGRHYGLGIKLVEGYLRMEDCTVISENGGGGLEVAGTADVINCTFTQTGLDNAHAWISTCLATCDNGVLNVQGGTYTSEHYSMYVYTSGGEMDVESGNFTGDVVNQVTLSSYPDAVGTVNISGGSFEGAGGNPIQFTTDNSGATSIAISGGTFDAPVENEYCAPGYIPSAEVAPGVYTVVPKDGVEIIGVVTTGGTNKTVTGLYKGDASVNLDNTKKLADGKYIFVTLKEGYTFEENDVLIIDLAAKSDLGGGTKALEITTGVGNIDGAVWKSIAYNDYTTGENIISLEGIAAGQTSIGLKRSANQNAKINGLRVLRPMNPVLKKVTVATVEGTPDNTNHVTIEVPASTTQTQLEDIAYEWVSNSDAWTAAHAPVATNTWEFGVENTVTFTDKDGDASEYYITVNKAAASTDATLSALTVNGQAVALADGAYDYSFELPYGTTVAPTVVATANHIAATATVDPCTLTGATITVVPESGEGDKQVYTLTFTVSAWKEVVIWDGSTMDAVKTVVAEDIASWEAVGFTGIENWTYATDEPNGKVPAYCSDNDKTYTHVNSSSKNECNIFRTGGNTKNTRYFKITVPKDYVAKFYVVYGSHSEGTEVTMSIGNEASASATDGILSLTTDHRYLVSGGVSEIVGAGDYYLNATASADFFEIRAYLRPGYARTDMLGNGVLGTICVPNNVAIEDIQGVTVYELMGRDYNNYGKLAFDEIVSGSLEAGVPYLFQAHGDKMVLYYGTTSVANPVNKHNGMYGTFTNQTLTDLDDVYYFAQRALWSCVDLTSLTLPANRAYVKLSEVGEVSNSTPNNGRRRITMAVNGEKIATDVENLEASEQPVKLLINGQIFILRGEKLYDATGRLVK